MSGNQRPVRLADKVSWIQGQMLINKWLSDATEVIAPYSGWPVIIITEAQRYSAAKIADKAIANMISSADFHP